VPSLPLITNHRLNELAGQEALRNSHHKRGADDCVAGNFMPANTLKVHLLGGDADLELDQGEDIAAQLTGKLGPTLTDTSVLLTYAALLPAGAGNYAGLGSDGRATWCPARVYYCVRVRSDCSSCSLRRTMRPTRICALEAETNCKRPSRSRM
jgi:hypothetical protein